MKPVMEEESRINGGGGEGSHESKKGDIIEIQLGTKTVKAQRFLICDTTKKKRRVAADVPLSLKFSEHLKRCGLRLFRQRIRGIFTRYYSYNN